MEREGFVFYRSFYEAIKNMDDSTCAACFRALCEYGLNGVEVTDDPIAAAILIMAKPNIDKNNKKYENGKLGGEYGKLGGRPKKENPKETPDKPQENPKETPKEKETEKETETDTEKSVKGGKKPRSTFTPPTLEEVQAYCQERGNHVDAERFIDYYTSNGWKVGKNSMKDWKAAVRNWEKQDAERVEGQSGVRQQGASNQKKNRFVNYPQPEHDFAEIERMERELREKW
ncbi:DUF6291 domain-containing protein [Anaerotignum sp.]